MMRPLDVVASAMIVGWNFVKYAHFLTPAVRSAT
jgi:hypothetical protein